MRPRQRLGLLIFGAALAALFAFTALSEGIGHPAVPEGAVAIVEEAAEGTEEIPVAEFRRQLRRAGVEAGLGRAPRPTDESYPELRQTVLASLISTAWIEGQAEEMGIEIHPLEVEEAFREYRAQFLARESTYRRYLRDSGQTTADVKENLRIGLLGAQISRQAARDRPDPDDAQVEAYYEAALPTTYTVPLTRDVRLVAIEDRAQAERARRALGREGPQETWRRLARRYANEQAARENAGLYEGLRQEGLAEPLAHAFFAAPLGEPQGPLETSRGFYVFEAVAEHPGEVEPLNEDTRRSIASILSRRALGEALEERQREFEAIWRERTTCAPAYAIELCANYGGPGRPPGASSACYEADPPEPPRECPAPVAQAQPALPGTITPLEPQGERLPQRPRPQNLTPPPEPPPFMPGAPPSRQH